MARTLEEMFKRNRRRGASTGVGTAYWPLGLYFNMPTFDVEAEALEGQVYDAGDEIAFTVGGRISEDGQEIVIAR